MATEFFVKLWQNHIIQLGVWQTVYMTLLTTLLSSGSRIRTGFARRRASIPSLDSS